MSLHIANLEEMIEESSALFDCYVERVFEAESFNDLISASHWYSDAMFCVMMRSHKL